MGRCCKGEACLIKHDASGDHVAISGKIKVAIPFIVRGIVDEKDDGTDGGTSLGSLLLSGLKGGHSLVMHCCRAVAALVAASLASSSSTLKRGRAEVSPREEQK
jgi:hypothetical protein